MLTRMLMPAPLALPLAVTLSALLASTSTVAAADHGPTPAAQSRSAAPDPNWVIAVGDIPSCGDGVHASGKAIATAGLAQQLQTAHPSLGFVGLGDENNGTGTPKEFTNCYAASGWGKLYNVTFPSPGNHEYLASSTAKGYFWYFGNRHPGTASAPYYAFDFGGWHFISLDSECQFVPGAGGRPGGCGKGSAQEHWLASHLTTFRQQHPHRCLAAFWHEPLFSSSSVSSTAPVPQRPMYAIWQDLAAARAALVLNGHYHGYERFSPMNAVGNADPAGVREIVPATGGSLFYPFRSPPAPHSQVRIANTPGVLLLALNPNSYNWIFYGLGMKVLDSGVGSVHACP
ncbi:metallophosphoesterase family protein [Actinoallomurus iriomotensis]|uniref:Alkaline phosphatase n=1 Tax=Actinoallomurus iriomotensis TaxID=478107 RepID=A0A9W6W2Y6_9ACTN|nr:metallophosphoesterase [Actinoallomurus iriomotensis]GLY88914.1 hypothetical protein Airi02_068430 [Actinoallomurus iriomotensis]